MTVHWADLATVLVTALGVTVLVVVLFSAGVTAWVRSGAGSAGRPRRRWRGAGGSGAGAGAVAVLCFAACLAVAGYAIDVIVPG